MKWCVGSVKWRHEAQGLLYVFIVAQQSQNIPLSVLRWIFRVVLGAYLKRHDMRSLDGFSFPLTGVHQAPARRGAETPRDAAGAAAPWTGHAAGQSHTNTQPSYYITMSFHLHNLRDINISISHLHISRIRAFDLMCFTDFFFLMHEIIRS